MQHLDEGTIHAWLDGELSPDEAGNVAAHASACPECAAMVAEARGLVAASTRILTALDDVPGRVIPSVPDIASAQIVRRRWYQRTDMRAAAALLLVAGSSLVVVQRGANSSTSRAMLATDDKGQATPAAGAEASAAGPAAVTQEVMADALSSSAVAPAPRAAKPAAPESRTLASPLRRAEAKSGLAVPRDQIAPANAMSDAQPTRLQARDESQLLKEEAAKSRAADVVSALPAPPPARVGGAAPPTVAAPAESRPGANAPTVATAGAAVSKAVAEAPLRVVRADSTSGVRRITYEVSKGVEVTLAESPVETALEGDAVRQKVAAPQSAAAPMDGRQRENVLSGRVAAAAASATTVATNSITWTERGRKFVLTGRLATKDLEAIKARLMQMRR